MTAGPAAVDSLKMRFTVGAIPESEDFDPEQEGFCAIREPDPGLIQLYAIPPTIVISGGLAALFFLCTPLTMDRLGPLQALVIFLLSLPVHELLHAVAHPRQGRSAATIIGIWPRRLIFFAHYDHLVPRNQFLLILALPFVVLSLLPLLVAVAFQIQWPGLFILSVANGATSCCDLIGIMLVGAQIPRRAVVRNQGWRSYWRPAL